MLKIQVLLHILDSSSFKFLMNNVIILEREQMKAIKAQVEEDQQFANALQLSIVMVSSLANDSAHASSSKAVSSQPGASASK